MSYQIHCEQFVYGKLVGIRGSRYELIASSSGITPDDTLKIYKGFNGYRPSATAIASFQKAYAIKVLADGQIALLRLARSKEKELGRGYFLQERYVILSSDDVRNKKIKLWLWLLGIPSDPPSFAEYGELSDHISLNEHKINTLLSKAIKHVSKDESFQRSIITTLYYILHSRPITISLHKKAFEDYWTWLTALSVLMPDSQVAETELYVGSSIPHNCKVDVSVVEGKSNQGDVRYQNLSNRSGNMLTLDQVEKGYTRLSWRCLETDDVQLLNELIATVKGANIHALPATPTTPYDVLLWMVAMPEVGLRLAWNELNKDELSMDDLQWLWRNSIERFTTDCAKTFFPILVERTLNDWGETDFLSLRKLINRMPNVIAKTNIDNELVPGFLERWISYTMVFASHESNWFASLLEQLAIADPTSTIILLIKWIGKAGRDNVFDNVSRVIQQIHRDSIKSKHYWEFVLALINKVRHTTDLSSLHEILCLISQEEKQPLVRLIKMIYDDGTNHNRRHRYEIALQDVIRSAEEAGESVKEIASALFFLIFLTENKEMLVALAIVISQIESDFHTRSSALIEEVIQSVENEWIFKSDNNELIASFIFIIGKLGHPEFSRNILTSLLCEDPEKFSRIAKHMQFMLRAKRDDLTISLEQMSNLPSLEQLNLLVEYILSTQRLPSVPSELNRLRYLLIEVPSLATSVSSENQAQLISVLENLGEWHISQRILEHQVRSALLRRNFARSYKIFERLRKCVEAMGIERIKYKTSLLKANSIISYWRALSKEQKEKFLSWLLNEPLSKAPEIEHKYLFLITSAILEKNRQWLSDDPVVRLCLFDEAIRIVRQR